MSAIIRGISGGMIIAGTSTTAIRTIVAAIVGAAMTATPIRRCSPARTITTGIATVMGIVITGGITIIRAPIRVLRGSGRAGTTITTLAGAGMTGTAMAIAADAATTMAARPSSRDNGLRAQTRPRLRSWMARRVAGTATTPAVTGAVGVTTTGTTIVETTADVRARREVPNLSRQPPLLRRNGASRLRRRNRKTTTGRTMIAAIAAATGTIRAAATVAMIAATTGADAAGGPTRRARA